MKFTAEAIIEIAERVEANAAEFYTKAAELHSAGNDVAFLRSLAKMELDHERQFAGLRQALPDSLRPDPADYPYLVASLRLDSMASAHGGEGTLSNAFPLTAQDSLRQVVLAGLRGEERTIVFYLELRQLLAVEQAQELVERIIAQERNHVAVLVGKLMELDSR